MARPWTHQASAAELAWSGRSVVVATGTASGKSLAYQLPVLSAAVGTDATALYLSPTKALAGDQLRALRALTLTQAVAERPILSRGLLYAMAAAIGLATFLTQSRGAMGDLNCELAP